MTTKKTLSTFFGEKVHRQQNPGYAYKKRAPPNVGMGLPEWLNRPCSYSFISKFGVIKWGLQHGA